MQLALLAGLCLATSPAFSATSSQAKAPALLVLGDSLSAEYGIPAGQGWVALMSAKLAKEGHAYKVLNSSISGETTSGGLTRLPALLKQHSPAIVIIELGANDALRGLSLTSSRNNLDTMVRLGKQAGSKVLLLGMQIPPNYGKRYSQAFAGMFQDVASTQQIALLPFFLKDVADRPDARDWFQSDGIHPLAKAHPVILNNVWPRLKPLLR
jgi:acyl-CoA thioesterase I